MDGAALIQLRRDVHYASVAFDLLKLWHKKIREQELADVIRREVTLYTFGCTSHLGTHDTGAFN